MITVCTVISRVVQDGNTCTSQNIWLFLMQFMEDGGLTFSVVFVIENYNPITRILFDLSYGYFEYSLCWNDQ